MVRFYGPPPLVALLIRTIEQDGVFPKRTRCTAFFLRDRHAEHSILTDRKQPGCPTRTKERELLSFSPCGRLLCPTGIVGDGTAHRLLIPWCYPTTGHPDLWPLVFLSSMTTLLYWKRFPKLFGLECKILKWTRPTPDGEPSPSLQTSTTTPL